MTTEQRGFSGTYDAAGHRQDVIMLLQGGKTGAELGSIFNQPRFTDEEILELRQRYAAGGITYEELAKLAGSPMSTLYDAVVGKTYREVGAA